MPHGFDFPNGKSNPCGNIGVLGAVPLGEGLGRSLRELTEFSNENSRREGYSQRARMCEVSSETSPY